MNIMFFFLPVILHLRESSKNVKKWIVLKHRRYGMFQGAGIAHASVVCVAAMLMLSINYRTKYITSQM
jgi:hypothetical protein